MDDTTWGWMRNALEYAGITIVGWLYIGHQKVHTRIDTLQDRVASLETKVEITQVMIKNVCDDIAEIKTSINKIADRV